MRLARLTTGPNTSPSRSSTRPLAMPTRTSDSASSLRNVAAMSMASAPPDGTSSVMNMTSSPIILMTRPLWAAVRS